MPEFEKKIEAVVDVTRPAFEGIEEMSTKEVGDLGEALARSFLCDNGLEIAEANWKTPFGEVDIVANDEFGTVFVEVKSRRLLGFSVDEIDMPAPEEAFDEKKFERYAKMAEFYQMVHEECEQIRFDVVGITFLSDRIALISYLVGGIWWGE